MIRTVLPDQQNRQVAAHDNAVCQVGQRPAHQRLLGGSPCPYLALALDGFQDELPLALVLPQVPKSLFGKGEGWTVLQAQAYSEDLSMAL